MLRFPDGLAAENRLQVGMYLLTVNTYMLLQYGMAPDLTPGPGDYERYGNFSPFIADFLSDDSERIIARKSQIEANEWRRAEEMGREYLKQHPNMARNGRPFFCELPAKQIA